MVRKCEWECSEDLIYAGCGNILHMQGVALLPKARNYPNRDTHFPLSRHAHTCKRLWAGIQIHSLASRLL